MRFETILLAAAAALPFFTAASSAEGDLDSVALVLVSGKAANGDDVYRFGSGVVVGNGSRLLTSLHTVQEPPGGWAVDQFGVKVLRMSVELRDRNTGLMTDVRPASIKATDQPTDAAVLEYSGTPSQGITTCPGAALAVGDIVLAVGVEPGRAGQPAHLDPRQGAFAEPQSSDDPFRRISVSTKPGFSGGPVFKVDGGGLRTLAGIVKAGDPLNIETYSLMVPLGAMRDKVLAACEAPCRHPDHGIDHYNASQEGGMYVSGWERGGTDPTSYCDAYAASERRRVPDRVVTVVHSANNDQRFFTGKRGNDFIVRESQYKFECKLRYDADPVYNLRVSPSCPAPANPLDLPR